MTSVKIQHNTFIFDTHFCSEACSFVFPGHQFGLDILFVCLSLPYCALLVCTSCSSVTSIITRFDNGVGVVFTLSVCLCFYVTRRSLPRRLSVRQTYDIAERVQFG